MSPQTLILALLLVIASCGPVAVATTLPSRSDHAPAPAPPSRREAAQQSSSNMVRLDTVAPTSSTVNTTETVLDRTRVKRFDESRQHERIRDVGGADASTEKVATRMMMLAKTGSFGSSSSSTSASRQSRREQTDGPEAMAAGKGGLFAAVVNEVRSVARAQAGGLDGSSHDATETYAADGDDEQGVEPSTVGGIELGPEDEGEDDGDEWDDEDESGHVEDEYEDDDEEGGDWDEEEGDDGDGDGQDDPEGDDVDDHGRGAEWYRKRRRARF